MYTACICIHAVYCTVLTGVGGGPSSQSIKESVQRSVESSASAANLILIHLYTEAEFTEGHDTVHAE